MKSDWVGTMYEVLGPEGPYQSICSGRIDCAVDLIERSLTTLDSVYNALELEGTKFESKDIMGFADGESQLWKETHYSDCYQIWQLNRQVFFELLTWVEKWIILDLEDVETMGQGWMFCSSCTYRDVWMQTFFSQPLVS